MVNMRRTLSKRKRRRKKIKKEDGKKEGAQKQASVSEFPNKVSKNTSQTIGKVDTQQYSWSILIQLILEPYIVLNTKVKPKNLNHL